ncbi:pentapeptide repeat-containing protein [Kordiimonas aestuarii]|uniref:pentapeptide repeat-containing protein n=1 Tax=Kordiimonas aestuarii TaxID=1005925 RepID=UPI0021D1206A|nr:pentapeptide repeat-containing protein [Kordiimonas aestuarii]
MDNRGASFLALTTLLTQLRSDAGWKSRKVVPVVIAVLGLTSDFLTPWYDLLSWLMPAAALLALAGFWLWRRAHIQGQPAQRAASTALYGLMSVVILLPISTINALAGGQTGVMAQVVPPLEKLQAAVNVRLDRVERALDVLTGAVEDQTGAVENVQQTMERSYAVEVLDRAMAARNGSNQGQVEAIESLLGYGYDFVEMDLSGISFRGAKLDGGDFSGGRKVFLNLDEASLRNSVLDRTDFALTTARRADFTGAAMEKVEAAFFDGHRALFAGARLKQANFYGADLSGADFSGADLSGASLAFADLSGADLRGADLRGAYLTGAILLGANLSDAMFGATNMLAVVAEQEIFGDGQRAGFCRHPIADRRFSVSFVEERSGPPYKGGSRYDNFLESWQNEDNSYGFIMSEVLADKSLPPCTTPDDAAPGFQADYPLNLRLQFEEPFLQIGRRSKKAYDHFIGVVKARQAAYEAGPLVRGTGAYRDAWLNSMQAVADDLGTVDTPIYLGSDTMMLLLMADGVLSSDNINWGRAAQARFWIEENKKTETFAVTGWPRFFPGDAAFDDLPKEAINIFRRWSERRAATLGTEFVIRPGTKLRTDAQDHQVLLMSGSIASVSSQSWSSRVSYALSSIGADTKSSLIAPSPRGAFDFSNIIMVFENPVREMGVRLPATLNLSAPPSGTEVTLVVTGIERLPTKSKRDIIVRVRPVEFRIRSTDGSIAFRAPLSVFPGL